MKHFVDQFPDRKININGIDTLYFGGTAYLGLQTYKPFLKIFNGNIKKYGTNYGASRKSNVQFSIYQKVENYLAALAGSEDCLTVSSGFLAGQFILQQFNTKEYKIFYAPNTHPALQLRLSKTYATFATLNIAIREHLASKTKEKPVVFLDSIDFSGCNYPDFEGLKALPLSDITLVVDDSHGIGIIGEEGGGIFSLLKPLSPQELIVCCSLSKAFGVQAGAIFADQERISRLKEMPLFGGASPATPANVATLYDAQKLYKERREQLQEHITYFSSNLHCALTISKMPNHPAFSFGNEALVQYLEKEHIVVTNFNYPNKDSAVMSRIVLSAYHKKKDLKKLLQLLNNFSN